MNGKEPRNERHSQNVWTGKAVNVFYELIVETAEVTVRVPFNGYELDDLEKQINRCFNEED